MTNYAFENFENLRKEMKLSKNKFKQKVETYAYGDLREKLYMDRRTIDKYFSKNSIEPDENALFKLANWYEEFLNIKVVDIKELTSRDLAKTNSISFEMYQLKGDYIGFYLDPTGSGDVKCMFLRLEEDGGAYAIHNLNNLDFLKNNKIDEISRKTMQEIYNSCKNRGSRMFSGKADGNAEVAIINLLYGSSRHRSTLTLDISSYLKYVKEENSKRP